LQALQPPQRDTSQHNNDQHEDDDHAALEAEAEHIASVVGGGRRVVGQNRQNFVGRALRVPNGMAPRGDIDGDFDANGDHVGGQRTHFGAYDYHHHGNNDDHHVTPYGDPYCRRDDDLERVKVSIPSFTEKEDVDAYFEWETKIEQIFDLYDYHTEKKAKLDAIQFKGYAITWWNQVCAEFHHVGQDYITWYDMKQEMRRHFIPAYYSHELHLQLK
jgi:hypothetical protein